MSDGRPDADPGNGGCGLPAIDNPAFRRGGFVTGIDRFDARFFGIRPIEARLMDPRQRMLLETSWLALEDAGIVPERLRGSRTGVYVGVSASEYRDLMTAGNDVVSYLGTAGSMTVGRVSFQLGLAGPTMPVELNCASALVAAHQAVAGLHTGEVDLALVGGVHAILSPAITLEMAELGLLSPTGRCTPFAATADGFVRGEGCGLVVLKRLTDAEAAGDRIWGVIRGSAVNPERGQRRAHDPQRAGPGTGDRRGSGPRRPGAERGSITWKRTGPDRSWATRSRCRRRPRYTAVTARPSSPC